MKPRGGIAAAAPSVQRTAPHSLSERPSAPCGQPLQLAALLALLMTAAALLAPTAALAKAGKPGPLRIEVPTPEEGNITIEGITTTIKSAKAKLALGAANARSLPSGVIVLSATRTERSKHETTYRTVLVSIDRRASASAARAASERLDRPSHSPLSAHAAGEITTYSDLALALFTGEVPEDGLRQTRRALEFEEFNRKLMAQVQEVVQPNANAGLTSAQICWALSATMQLAGDGKPAPGVSFGFFDGPTALPWHQDGIGSVFMHLAADCRAGADGLSSALTPMSNDLGFSVGQLGPLPAPPPGPTPVAPKQAEEIFWGALLNDEPEVAEEALEDYVLWLEIEEFLSGGTEDSLLAPAPFARAHASSTRSGAVPENGQVTKVEVRGYYVGECPTSEEEGHFCERHIHFQDLRKLSDGELEVVSTTQAFTLPKKEEHGENKHTFEPTNFFVQKGDYIGLATVGGKFEVLLSASAATTDSFKGHNKDMNGDHLTVTQKAGRELNMRITLKPSA